MATVLTDAEMVALDDDLRVRADIDALVEAYLEEIGALTPKDDAGRNHAADVADWICRQQQEARDHGQPIGGSWRSLVQNIDLIVKALREYADPPVFTEVKPGELGTSHLLDKVDALNLEIDGYRSTAKRERAVSGFAICAVAVGWYFAVTFLILLIAILRSHAS